MVLYVGNSEDHRNRRLENPPKVAVWYCSDCGMHTSIDDSKECPGDCQTEQGKTRIRRRRLGYLCGECSYLFRYMKYYKDHECTYA